MARHQEDGADIEAPPADGGDSAQVEQLRWDPASPLLQDSQVKAVSLDESRHSPEDHSLKGLLWFGASTVFMSTMLVLVKLLGQWGVPVFLILLVRSMTVLTCASLQLLRTKTSPLGNRRKLLCIRGILGFGANGGYFWTVNLLPLNDAMVLSFLAPVWTGLLSPFLLKEKPGKITLVAIPLCLVGVILIAHPQMASLNHDAMVIRAVGITVALFQALSSAGAKMCVRELRTTEAPNVIVFYLASWSSLGALLGLVLRNSVAHDWRGPANFKEAGMLLTIGLLGYCSQISLTYGLRSAKATPAMAMSYLSVVWTIIYGYLVFKEVPTATSILGALLIVSCTFLMGVFDSGRKAKAPPTDSDDEQTAMQTPLLAAMRAESEEGSKHGSSSSTSHL